MTTLADVARRAQVSSATVSLVLSSKDAGRVSPETARRVRRAASELGYVRDALAAGMSNGRTRTIGVIGERALSTPYAVAMIGALLAETRQHGWTMLLTDTGSGQTSEDEAAREMISRRVDFVVFAAMYHHEVVVPERLSGAVVLNGFADRPGIPGIVPDERQGASSAARHLLGLGHRRIGMVADALEEAPAVRLRHESFAEELAAAGSPLDEALVARGDNNPDGADAAARRLLDRPDRPTAVFCYNDGFAAGIFRQASRLGLSIPGDLSVIGFDDLALISTNLDPRLTTMRLPHVEMGRWLATEITEGRGESLEELTRFECPLIERGSTGPPHP